MTGGGKEVEEHYTRSGLGEAILEALRRVGKDIDNIKPDDLAPVDEFHIRGREATIELARLVKPGSGAHVLDVGCGIGGPSRHLATEFGCHVIGLDLTQEYVRVAAMLAERTGLGDRVAYRHGDALDMPFDDATFDFIWTQHASMNIPDKGRLYSEMYRVLKPGGRLALYDLTAGKGGEVYYPVPWAQGPSTSFLVSADDMRAGLEKSGFNVVTWEDVTLGALKFFLELTQRKQAGGPPPLGYHLFFGEGWPAMVQNQIRNLEENRIALAQAVLERAR